MTRVPRPNNDGGRVISLHLARDPLSSPTPRESGRSTDAWLRELTVLDGGTRQQSLDDWNRPAIPVVLAESAGLVRAGLRSLLEREPDIRVAGEASSGEEALAVAADVRPDVVLMDVHLSGLGALEATRQIVADRNLLHTRVVILTSDAREEDLFGALRAGASGFVLLDTEPIELVRAVRVVADGGAQLSPWATRRLLEQLASNSEPESPHLEQFEELTARERDMVLLVALGLTNGEIAQRLVISPATVKTHVSRAMVKLQARDRAKLVAIAYQTGFVEHHRAADASVAHWPALRLAGGQGA
jgi:DNA-binding NarL/FixJ family response regulator